MKKLAIVIVNYKSREYLDDCISSVFDNFSNFNFEIIIVNNDKNKLEGFSEEGVKIIELNKNIGFGASCNIGAKESSSDMLLFLNPDTIILSKSLDKVMETFNEDKEIGIIGSKILEESGNTQKWSVGSELGIINIIKNKIGFSEDTKIIDDNKKREVDWVTGAAMFVRAETFIRLKGFDKNFFLYFEDVDLCKRVRNIKKKVVYFPDFKVRHLGGKSSSNKKEQKKEYYKSQDYYFDKWFGEKTKLVLKILRIFNL